MRSVLTTLDGVLLPLREVCLPVSFGVLHGRRSDPPCATMKRMILWRHIQGRHLLHPLRLLHHHRNVRPLVQKVVHGGLNTACPGGYCANLQLRGQSHSARGGYKYIKFVGTISCSNYNLWTTPLQEVCLQSNVQFHVSLCGQR